MSVQTVRKWMKEQVFLDKLKQASPAIYEDVYTMLKADAKDIYTKLTEAADRALDVLMEVMESDGTKPADKLKAADSILDRTADTARNRKVEQSGNIGHTLDPVLLMHAAATAQEVDVSQQKQKALERPKPKPLSMPAEFRELMEDDTTIQ